MAALCKFTGDVQWSTSLPATGYGVVTLLHRDGVLCAACRGRVLTLGPKGRSILWCNELPGLGGGDICPATVRASANAGPDPLPLHAATQSRSSSASVTSPAGSHGHWIPRASMALSREFGMSVRGLWTRPRLHT